MRTASHSVCKPFEKVPTSRKFSNTGLVNSSLASFPSMWGSHHRKMVSHANRGDGGHEERQDAVPPLSKGTAWQLASNSPRQEAHRKRISRRVDRSPPAAFFMGGCFPPSSFQSKPFSLREKVAA